jgi:F-type H+-transporting ATPase subunit delta
LIDALGRRFEREIQLSSRVDRGLLGGAIIRAGDTVIDGSIRGKLDKLSETLQRV